MKKILGSLCLCSILAFANVDKSLEDYGITQEQLRVLNTVYNLGKQYKSSDGQSFEKIISGIYLQESWAGRDIIGDKYSDIGYVKSIYESSLGAGQIQLGTAQTLLSYFPELRKKYSSLSHNNIYSYKTYSKHLTQIAYFKGVLGTPDISKKTKDWAEKELATHKKIINEKYLSDIKKDDMLVNKLLTDIDFSTTLSIHYLIMNYEVAKKKGFKNPMYSTISKYNGGWENPKYYSFVAKRMKTIDELVSLGFIEKQVN